MHALTRRLMLSTTIGGLAAAAMPLPVLAQAQPTAPANTEWRSYGGDLAHARHAPLDQINGENFNKLEVAWEFSTKNLGPRAEVILQGTPLLIKGKLYCTAGARRDVVCLDAATGEMRRAGFRAAASAIGPTAPSNASSMSPSAIRWWRWMPAPA
jgi:quinoprotein glucose dehydrogenase